MFVFDGLVIVGLEIESWFRVSVWGSSSSFEGVVGWLIIVLVYFIFVFRLNFICIFLG